MAAATTLVLRGRLHIGTMTDELCIHEIDPATCSLCLGKARDADPNAVSAGVKAAESRSGRVALPPRRFDEEVDAAIGTLTRANEPVTVAAVQRIIRAAGYESGRRPTNAALRARGHLGT
jgi:hypothetical protein